MHKKRNRIVVWKILNYSKYNFLSYQSKCSIKNILATRKRFEILPLSRNCLSSSDHDSEKGGRPYRSLFPSSPFPFPGNSPAILASRGSRSIVIYRLIRLHLEKTSAVFRGRALFAPRATRIRGPRGE